MPELLTALPEALQLYLKSSFGEATKTEKLSGIAGSGATRIHFGNQSVIVKSSQVPRERWFYEAHASKLRDAGVESAILYWSGMDATGLHWIVLEDIPHPFPQAEWVNNAQQLKTLFILHLGTWGTRRPTLDKAHYAPSWDDHLTRRAASWFEDEGQHDDIHALLKAAEQMSQALFEPLCGLQGDPNPTNWRIRDNGVLVPIDWERYCCGHPAIDLAITIPGFGNKDGSSELQIASRYLSFWIETGRDAPFTSEDLAGRIRLAKCWSVVEFIAGARLTPEAYPQETISFITQKLPDALKAVVQ